MKRRFARSIVLASCFAAAACDGIPSEEASPTDSDTLAAQSEQDAARAELPPSSRSYRAELRCSLNGSPVIIAMCLSSPDRDSIPGDLKIRSGASVRQYTSTELQLPPFFGNLTTFDLEAPFEMRVRTNEDHNIVLKIEIRNGSKTVFRDELGSLSGVIITDDMMADANDVARGGATSPSSAGEVSDEMKRIVAEAQRDAAEASAKAGRAAQEASEPEQ